MLLTADAYSGYTQITKSFSTLRLSVILIGTGSGEPMIANYRINEGSG